MIGVLSGGQQITGRLTPDPKCALTGSVSRDLPALTGNLTHPTVSGIEVYDGDYVVDPEAASAVILQTKRKLLTDDVTVNQIRYVETLNPSGGTTVFIG